jgi:CBS domain-containing protein
MKIEELMSKEVMVVQEDTPVKRMLKLFAKHDITGAPVINESGELKGVVSLSDLFRTGAAKDSHEFYLNPSWSSVPHEEHAESTAKVADIMTHLVIFVEADDDIERACDLMTNHGIHRIVVTHDGKVVGMISSGDLVREFRDRLKAAKK